ncbi:MAG: IS21 family transposase [Bacteroidota bacterium]
MEDWVTIRNLKKRNSKLGTRKIADLMNVSRNTVKNALKNNKEPQPTRNRKINPEIKPFKDYIYEKLVVKGFQGSRVLEEIISKGYEGSRSAFYRYIDTVKPSNSRTYQPYETAPGEQSQFDWSPYTVTIAGTLVKIFVFSYINSFSRYRIYEGSLSETQSSVFEALENSLLQCGGVAQRIQTDNATCLVTNASRSNLQWNKRYLQFCGHIGFTPTRSLPGHPWSKGKVERPFDYVEEHFIKGNRFTSFHDFIDRLKEFQDKVNNRVHSTTRKPPAELFEQEKDSLLELPADRYVGVKEEVRKATADCLISFDGNKYSIPYLFACKEVWIKVSRGYELNIYSSQNKLIATHCLVHGKGQVILNNAHYKNHNIERGNWDRMSKMFVKLFPDYDWFLDKLKTQKKINKNYHLTHILKIAKYYHHQDMKNAFCIARDYNTYNHVFIRGYMEHHAQIIEDVPELTQINPEHSSSTISIKRPLAEYNIVNHNN